MNYTAYDLNPANPVLIIDGFELEFNLLTLNRTVKLRELYGEIHEMFGRIEKDINILYSVLWHLLIDKTYYKKDFKNFKKDLQRFPLKKLGEVMISTLHDIVEKSMPLVINRKRMEEIRKLQTSKEDVSPCYAKYYDSLAKRYGLTLESFYNLTLRQISIMLETISEESYNELELKASLAGKKLKPRIQYNQVTPEEEEENEQEAMDTVSRLRKEWEEKQKNKES